MTRKCVKRNTLVLATCLIGSTAWAVSGWLPFSPKFNSATEASTVMFRDASGDVQVNALTVDATTSLAGQLSTTSTIKVSSSATSALPAILQGAYSSTEIASLSGVQGKMVINTTLYVLCVGTGTTATNGAYILPKSTSTTAVAIPCY